MCYCKTIWTRFMYTLSIIAAKFQPGGFVQRYQGGGILDKTLGICTGRSGVRIPGRGKCSLRTIAVDARVNYPLYLSTLNTMPTVSIVNRTVFMQNVKISMHPSFYVTVLLLLWRYYDSWFCEMLLWLCISWKYSRTPQIFHSFHEKKYKVYPHFLISVSPSPSLPTHFLPFIIAKLLSSHMKQAVQCIWNCLVPPHYLL